VEQFFRANSFKAVPSSPAGGERKRSSSGTWYESSPSSNSPAAAVRAATIVDNEAESGVDEKDNNADNGEGGEDKHAVPLHT
jgi:hypothetical protein